MTATVEETTTRGGAVGRIARVIGPVVDIEFPTDSMPPIYNALTCEFQLSGESRRSSSRSPSTSVTAWSAPSR